MKHKSLVWGIIILWLLAAGAASFIGPPASEVVTTPPDSGLPESAPSIEAEQKVKQAFPDENGIPLLAVVESEKKLKAEMVTDYAKIVESSAEEFEHEIKEILPLSQIPEEHRGEFQSEDAAVFFIPMMLKTELENGEINEVVENLQESIAKSGLPTEISVFFTGPAGILSDTISLFSQADLVLLFSTIGLIFILLIVIYRSPVLAVIPLLVAAITYQIADRLIGLGGEKGWFVVENQALSIMMVLLFAVLTDYALLIVARYREELQTTKEIIPAMIHAVRGVFEPIVFSGGTIIIGVLTLLAAVYAPYHNFAIVFAIAVAVMVPAGLTLLPALIVVTGRAAFWPLKQNTSTKPLPIWPKIAKTVNTHPRRIITGVLLLFSLGIISFFNMTYNYDLLDSFPDDLTSKEGYDVLSDAFSPGELAPNTVLIESDTPLEEEYISAFEGSLSEREQVDEAFLFDMNEDETIANVRVLLKQNPYSSESLDETDRLREEIEDYWPGDANIYIAGEAAKHADIRGQNETDTANVMILMTIGITIILGFLTRSVIAPLFMMGTLLISYAASLGLVRCLFTDVFNGGDISYRIPLYTFVFMIALGVDYSIMLISRIKQEKKNHSLESAVSIGIEKTGGVISAAGIILAGTFAILITQPVMELRLFGIAMALGILVDTFIVRPFLLPAIILLCGKWSFWLPFSKREN
ncbi:MMPL family transporter [Virgibacillus kimchii]